MLRPRSEITILHVSGEGYSGKVAAQVGALPQREGRRNGRAGSKEEERYYWVGLLDAITVTGISR